MDVVVVDFEGGIEQFPRLIQTVDGLLADGERRLVLDLHLLPFINSAALGYLIKVQQTLNEWKGQLALVRVQPAIRNILVVTHLEKMFALFADAEAALEAWGVHGHGHAHADAAAPKPVVKRRPLSPKR